MIKTGEERAASLALPGKEIRRSPVKIRIIPGTYLFFMIFLLDLFHSGIVCVHCIFLQTWHNRRGLILITGRCSFQGHVFGGYSSSFLNIHTLRPQSYIYHRVVGITGNFTYNYHGEGIILWA